MPEKPAKPLPASKPGNIVLRDTRSNQEVELPASMLQTALEKGYYEPVDPAGVEMAIHGGMTKSTELGPRPYTIGPAPAGPSLEHPLTPPSAAWLKSKAYGAAETALPAIPWAGQVLGAIGGGATGGALTGTPVGMGLGAVGGAGLGGMAGKELELKAKRGLGFTAPPAGSPEEEWDIYKEGYLGMLSEGVGRIGTKGLSMLGRRILQQLGKGDLQATTLAAENYLNKGWISKEEFDTILKEAALKDRTGQLAKFWGNRGITLTWGERDPGGWAEGVEKVAGKTALAKRKVGEFVGARQPILKSTLEKSAEAVGTTPAQLDATIKTVVDNHVSQIELDIEQQHKLFSGIGGGTKAEVDIQLFGDTIIGSSHGSNDVLELIRRTRWSAHAAELDKLSIEVPGAPNSPASTAAREMLEKSLAAGEVAVSDIDRPAMRILRKAGGVEKLEAKSQELFSNAFNSLSEQEKSAVRGALSNERVPLGDMMRAVSGVKAIIRQMEAQGRLSDPTVGALKRWVSMANHEVWEAMPPALRAEWDQLRVITKVDKQLLNNAFMRRVFATKNPMVAEEAVRYLMRKGSAAEAEQLMALLQAPVGAGAEPANLTILRQGVMDWLKSSAKGDGELMIKLMDEHPAVKIMLGERYQVYRQFVEQLAARESSPARAAYKEWLNTVSGMVNPSQVVRKSIGSPIMRNHLLTAIEHKIPTAMKMKTAEQGVMDFIPSSDALRRQAMREVVNSVLDDATVMPGAKGKALFGEEGSYIDLQKLYASTRKAMPALRDYAESMLGPKPNADALQQAAARRETVDNFMELVNKMQGLRFSTAVAPSSGESISATFSTLSSLGILASSVTAAYGAGQLMFGAASQDKSIWDRGGRELAFGIGGLHAIYAPKHFIDIALNPKLAKMLAEGTGIPAKGLVFSRWLIRFLDAYDEQQKLSSDPQRHPEAWGNPPAPLPRNVPNLLPPENMMQPPIEDVPLAGKPSAFER